ncbi:VTT domain-containing protein [Acidihalobacter prosperus]
MHEWVQVTVSWIVDHPDLSMVIVFLVALSESLAVVGLLIPGAGIMFAVGALVAAGVLNIWMTLGAAVTGAIVGDSLSYWLGYHYKDYMVDLWPFRAHPQWLSNGKQFFVRHGGKSVLFGRFVGPMRPIIPIVAGMMRMPPSRFLAANIISALLWAPAYLAPGVGLGFVFDYYSYFAFRLALLLGLLGLVLWLTGWLVFRIHYWFVLLIRKTRDAIAAEEGYLPWPQAFLKSLAERKKTGLSIGVIVVFMVAGAIWGVHILSTSRVWLGINGVVEHYLGELGSPAGDHVMSWLGSLATGDVLFLLVLWGSVWFAMRGTWSTLLYWLVGVLPGAVLLMIQSFSAGQFLLLNANSLCQVTLYGLISTQASHAFKPPLRWIPYALAGLLVMAAGLARIYLGIDSFSGWIGGILAGVIWVALIGTIWVSRAGYTGAAGRMLTGFVIVILAGLVWGYHPLSRRPISQALLSVNTQMPTFRWWQAGWQTLPAYRKDLVSSRSEPFNLQWAGSLVRIQAYLARHGCNSPPALNWVNALNWLLPGKNPRTLPLLPLFNNDQPPVVTCLYSSGVGGNEKSSLILRLWPSTLRLKNGPRVWIGNLRRRRLLSPLGLLLLPHYEIVPAKDWFWLNGSETKVHRVVRRIQSGQQAPVFLIRFKRSKSLYRNQ